MSALRILHVVPYYEHAWAYGGIPRVATALARGLAGRPNRGLVPIRGHSGVQGGA